MAADLDNVRLGVCSVTYKGTDLGHTKGGVVVTYEPDYHDLTVDKYGSTVAKKWLIGEKLMAKVPLAEATLAMIARVIPAGVDSVTGKVTIGRQAGYDMDSEAGLLVLHPIANAAGDRSEDVVIHKALVTSPLDVPFQVDSERILEATFEALIDEAKSSGNYLGLFGDSTAA